MAVVACEGGITEGYSSSLPLGGCLSSRFSRDLSSFLEIQGGSRLHTLKVKRQALMSLPRGWLFSSVFVGIPLQALTQATMRWAVIRPIIGLGLTISSPFLLMIFGWL